MKSQTRKNPCVKHIGKGVRATDALVPLYCFNLISTCVLVSLYISWVKICNYFKNAWISTINFFLFHLLSLKDIYHFMMNNKYFETEGRRTLIGKKYVFSVLCHSCINNECLNNHTHLNIQWSSQKYSWLNSIKRFENLLHHSIEQLKLWNKWGFFILRFFATLKCYFCFYSVL